MAKHIIVESYAFTPSTSTIVVTGKTIRAEQLLLITNVTTGNVIYNFSDPSLGYQTITNSISTTTGQETTTIVLEYSTTSMTSTDKLAIMVEETYTEITPSETMRDPVDKLRTSSPQSLIDTDFEYGTQPTKWESINLCNNRPTAFYDVSTLAQGVVNITASSTKVSVQVSTTAGISVGTPIFVTGTQDPSYADGWWLIENVNAVQSLSTVTISGTAGQFTCAAATLIVGQTLTISGTLGGTGTITGYSNPTTYVITATNGSTTFTLSTTAGAAIVTTAGTPTGLTYTVNAQFVYDTTNAPTLTTLYDSTKTYVYTGNFFSGAGIPTTSITLSGTAATVTTTNTHGLQPGNAIWIVGTTGVTGLNSSYTVATTPTVNTFTFATTLTGTVTLAGGATATLYPRPLGYTVHRPFDGGVQFTNVSPYQNYQVIRQTRRYFRYQSGKAIQFSTGSILKPALQIDNISGSGTTATVTTKFPHGLLQGCGIKVIGCNQSEYNGTGTAGGSTYVVLSSGLTPTQFQYTTSSTVTAATASGFPITISPNSWYGASTRVGMFDSQNGFYFEFDGQTLYAVKRSSTQQISGTITVTNASNTITGNSSTKFAEELIPGDFVVIRGMSYIVQSITSNTNMHIYPEFRGTTASAVVASKTVNTKYEQNTWNIDKCDGTGASKFTVDLTKMQMFYIDYTWYGAGAIRFGFKNNRGEVVYCHRIPNNNVNTEAYMRSGNLPARYETNTLPPYTYLTATLSSAATTGATISVADSSRWPSSGTVILTAAGNTSSAIEYISYTANTGTALTIGARAQTGGTTATTFTYSATAPIQAELYSPQCASTISHWGSSVIMDGRFDDDKSYIFQAGMSTAITIGASPASSLLMSIRLAPSVDNGATGLLGARDIINRMQLTLRQMDVFNLTSASCYRIELILNGRVSGGTFQSAGGSSLAQICFHTAGQTITGGETIFSFFVPAGVTQQDLSLVRDLGNSILGGGTSLTAPTTAANLYPDGPDIISIRATNVTSTSSSVNARISWTEAQA